VILCAWCGAREATEEIDGREICKDCREALEVPREEQR
jgi:hypothetical protein